MCHHLRTSQRLTDRFERQRGVDLFSACVAAVKSRPVLHHCVVIFFWSSGIMECTCMLFTFENGVPLMR